MAKAVEGAALLAGGIALQLSPIGGFVGELAIPMMMSGATMLAGAIASALTANRGENITTRQPAAARQVIYGMQRVGGVLIKPSTTGSTHNQYNKIIVIASHVCDAIEAVYLDGRRLFFSAGSPGNVTSPGGTDCGGASSGDTYVGPNGVKYSFGGLAYFEPRYGNQVDGDYITGMTANDPSWGPTAAGTPWVGGCCYGYLKVEYNQTTFPNEPEVRFTVRGKQLLDPRTGTVAWSANSALVIADFLSDPVYGMGLVVNQEQLIAAANVCDEQVVLAGGGTESRYTCHHHFDTNTAPSDTLDALLKSCGGRYSIIGGEVFIWPAYWQGPSFAWDESSLTGPVKGSAYSSYRELANVATGTYTAPNYPYNIAGNLYDSNGFDADGNIQDNFQFAFQRTSIPQYACDPQHGYPTNQYLNQDSGSPPGWSATTVYGVGATVAANYTQNGSTYAGVFTSLVADNLNNSPDNSSTKWRTAGKPLTAELTLDTVLSISQAQRLLKIHMMKTRFPGKWSLEMRLGAFRMQPTDVMNFTFPLHGWTDKQLEVRQFTWKIVTGETEPGKLPPPAEQRLSFNVDETSETIYEWEPSEEQSIYGLQVAPTSSTTVAPPTDVVVISSAATALVAPDGTVTPRLQVTWDTPEDGLAVGIQIQHQPQPAGAITSTWLDDATADISCNTAYISPVIAGQLYGVRVRTVRYNGAVSEWVEIDGILAGLVLSITSQDGYGLGSLQAAAYASGDAAVICNPFTALVGNMSLPIFPSGAVTLTIDGTLASGGGPGPGNPIAQQTLYFVYYYDPTYAGGNVTPIATTNPADFRGKLGYFLIDSIVTPYSGAVRYAPTTYSDTGTLSTGNPTQAYDGNTSTSATVSGSFSSVYLPGHGDTTHFAYGDCTWLGFPAIPAPSALNLYLTASATTENPDGGEATVTVIATINGTATPITFPVNSGQQTVSAAVPVGTPMGSITLEVEAHAEAPPASSSDPGTGASASVAVAEIYIST